MKKRIDSVRDYLKEVYVIHPLVLLPVRQATSARIGNTLTENIEETELFELLFATGHLDDTYYFAEPFRDYVGSLPASTEGLKKLVEGSKKFVLSRKHAERDSTRVFKDGYLERQGTGNLFEEPRETLENRLKEVPEEVAKEVIEYIQRINEGKIQFILPKNEETAKTLYLQSQTEHKPGKQVGTRLKIYNNILLTNIATDLVEHYGH